VDLALAAVSAVLQTHALVRRFGALLATDRVSLALERGARQALIGPNGAGKTTLVNLLAGVLAPSSGRIELDGHDIAALPVHVRARRGLVRTFQINQLFASFTPRQSLALAVARRQGASRRWWQALGRDAAVMRECDALLAQFRLDDVAAQRTAELPYGKQRLLEIALAIALRPRVLLLDEPVAGVPAAERREILDTVAGLPEEVAVLLIEHDMDVVFGFANRISVLVDGALLREGAPQEIADDAAVRAAYLGDGEAAPSPVQPSLRRTASSRPATPPLLRIERLRAGYGEGVVIGGDAEGLSLTLEAGHSMALLGRNGAGKTTLIASIAGLTRRHGGSVHLAGKDLTQRAPFERAAAGIGLVPQERNIFRSLSVEENLTAVARPGPFGLARAWALFPRLAERRRHLGQQLSGGEQQMLAIARALMLNPRLLLLDEPTEGLAPILVAELLRTIAALVRQDGLSAIIVEQHAAKVLPLTDEAVILERGLVVYAGPSSAVGPELLERHLGLAAR
jgi:branched-chain amino acid transport system ATP-binding protein